MSHDANRVPQRSPGRSFPILFDRGGVFRAHAALNGVSVGALVVNVVHVDFDGPIACEVGFTREKGVVVYGPPDQVFFTAQNPALLEVSVKETTPYGVRLYLRPLGRGTPVLQARLGAADGPVIAQREIDEFTVECSAATHVVINAANNTGTATLTMRPLIPYLVVDFDMFASYSTFAGGATAFRVNTSDVAPDGNPVFAPVVDPATGETHGVCSFEIEVPEGENSYCFSAAINQHSTYGTVTGLVWCNGKPCEFSIEPRYILEGDTQDHLLFVTASTDNPNNKVNHPVGVYPVNEDGDHEHVITPEQADKFRIKGQLTYDCKGQLSQDPPNAFWIPTVALLATGNCKAGQKYGVTICKTPFPNVIIVVGINIMWNTFRVNNDTNDIMVGKKLRLRGEVIPADLPLTCQWTLPPTIVEAYRQELTRTTKATLEPDSPALRVSNIDYYWIDAGMTRDVKFTISVGDDTFEAKTTFNVWRPTRATLTSTTTRAVPAVAVSNRWDGRLRLIFGSAINPGIAWDAEVEVMVPYGVDGEGEIAFTQLINADYRRTLDNVDSTREKMTTGGAFVLDDALGIQYNGTTPIDNVTPSQHHRTDTPSAVLKPEEKTLSASMHFVLYLMYKPKGDDSIWVTLRELPWSWQGSATKDTTTGAWSLVGAASDVDPGSSDSTTLPEWDDFASGIRWQPDR